MATRVFSALFFLAECACLLLAAPAAAITVRFDTNVGNIDLLLNPTNNPNLQGHVDNMFAYIDSGRYSRVVLNRAVSGNSGSPADDFVLQFGGFITNRQVLPSSFSGFTPVETFDSVQVDSTGDNQIDFATAELLNTRGTVSLALSSTNTTGSPSDPGTPTVNSGTSSFFVNISDNEGLDDGAMSTFFDSQTNQNRTVEVGGFVPFARVVDMSTVDFIMRLNQASLSGGGAGSSDIPVLGPDNNLLVFVEQAYCLDCGDADAMAMMALVAEDGNSPASESSASSTLPNSSSSQAVAVPEPPALVLAVGAFMVLTILKGPRR